MQVLALLLSALILIVLDQSTKALVRDGLGETRILSLGWVAVRPRLNRRAFLGPLSNRLSLLIFLATEVTMLVAVTLLDPLIGSPSMAASLGIAAGGATSNVIDQLRHQGVVDFIDLGWWPAFNLADLAIVVGASLALISFVIAAVAVRPGLT